jgi:hypothetical protein
LPKPYMRFSSLPYLSHAPQNSSFFTSSSNNVWWKVWSMTPLICRPLITSFLLVPTPFSAHHSQTPLTYILPLTLSDPTSDLVRQYDFLFLLRCRKTSDTVFVAFVCPLSEPARRSSSCSTDFSQQIAQVELFLFLHVFLF